jgi:cell division protein FtsZ
MNAVPVNFPGFLLIGIGGTATRILDQVRMTPIPNLRTVAVETDRYYLDRVTADIKILLGNNQIKAWTEGDPAESARAAIEARAEFESLFKSGDIVFLVAGLGGGAGSGAAPPIARIAREKGALVIAIMSMPFLVQQKTIDKAKGGLQLLLRSADSVIVLDNDRFRVRYSSQSVSGIHAKVNEIIVGIIRGLVSAVTIPNLINCEPDDIRAIFQNRGLAMVLDGESEDGVVNTNESVIRKCLQFPSLDIDYRGALGCFVLINGGYDLDLYDAEVIATDLSYDLDPHADVVWTAHVEKALEGKVRVTAIFTGCSNPYKNGIIHWADRLGK